MAFHQSDALIAKNPSKVADKKVFSLITYLLAMGFTAKRIETLLLLLLWSHLALAQYKNVKIDGQDNPSEPSIFINPKFPNQVVAAAAPGKVYLSRDFGNTWKARELKSRYGIFGAPAILADNEGVAYYFHPSDPEDLGWKSSRVMDRMVGHVSKNGWRWNRGKSIGHQPPHQHDKQWAVFDEYSNNIYLTWTQYDRYDSSDPRDSSHVMFSYSNDRGKSWKPAIRINRQGGDCHDMDMSVVGAHPAVGPRGEVYVAWAHNEKIYFDKSIDGGIMWLKNDKEIARQPGGSDVKVEGMSRCKAYPTLVCDLSYGEHHGDIYVSWYDQKNGEENSDVWIVKSGDGGETWSTPKRVNDDRSGRHQFMSRMAIDQVNGHLYIVFYDRRNHEDTKTDVYLAYSTNGGESFTNVKISESPFVPDENTYYGSYVNISAFAGYIRPVWTRTDNGKTSIYTAIIDTF